MELLRWQIGDARVFRIADVDATPALQGLIPKFNPAAVSRAACLTPNFVDGVGRLRGLVHSDTLIIGTHFADPVAGRIRRKGSTFLLTATGS